MRHPDVSVVKGCVGVFPDGPKKAEVVGDDFFFYMS